MADCTLTATPSDDIQYSISRRTVTLYDWWLIKTKNDSQEKRLAVGGVSSKKGEAMCVFISAPIIKRYDEFYLETVDGICVVLSGFINKQRTIENGFDPQTGKTLHYISPEKNQPLALIWIVLLLMTYQLAVQKFYVMVRKIAFVLLWYHQRRRHREITKSHSSDTIAMCQRG